MNHPPNASFGIDANDPLFYVCWRRQSCGWCLRGDVACSWCAVVNLPFFSFFFFFLSFLHIPLPIDSISSPYHNVPSFMRRDSVPTFHSTQSTYILPIPIPNPNIVNQPTKKPHHRHQPASLTPHTFPSWPPSAPPRSVPSEQKSAGSCAPSRSDATSAPSRS